MVLDNTKSNKVIHNKLKICEFCSKELNPIGLEFLYENISSDVLEYERCTCTKAQEYWKEKDNQKNKAEKRKYFREIINKIYKKSYIEEKFQNMNFENFDIHSGNEIAIKVAKDYANKCVTKIQRNGLIITGKSGIGKTHLAASIANKLIENEQIVLMGRLTTLLDAIKETFGDSTKSESKLIELYSNVDMMIIDDLGTEKISNWALEKIYTIIENRNENGLPIIITTRFDKCGLIERFSQSQDVQLADAVISKLYQMCYGIMIQHVQKS